MRRHAPPSRASPKLVDPHLNAARAIAAITVVVDHVRNLLFVDAPDLGPHAGGAAVLVYALTGFGHQAVMVFFVLSGYLVGGSVLQAWRRGSWSWSEYLVRRLSRLWTVLIPALALCAAVDSAGMWLLGTHNLYGGHGSSGQDVIEYAVGSTLSPAVLLGNALFLQTVRAPVYGSDAALWSLANEFWYYLLFPLAVGALGMNRRAVGRLAAAAAAVAILVLVGPGIGIYFVVWLLGAALAAISIWRAALLGPGSRVPLLAVGAGGLAAALGLARSHHLGSALLSDAAVGVSFTILLAGLLCRRRRQPERGTMGELYSFMCGQVADRSYTLYLVHLPPLVLAAAWLAPASRWRPDAPHLGIAAATVGVIGLYTLVISEVTERRTDRVRDWVRRHLRLTGATTAAEPERVTVHRRR